MLMCFTPEELAANYIERKIFEELESAYANSSIDAICLDKAVDELCSPELAKNIWARSQHIKADLKAKRERNRI